MTTHRVLVGRHAVASVHCILPCRPCISGSVRGRPASRGRAPPPQMLSRPPAYPSWRKMPGGRPPGSSKKNGVLLGLRALPASGCRRCRSLAAASWSSSARPWTVAATRRYQTLRHREANRGISVEADVGARLAWRGSSCGTMQRRLGAVSVRVRALRAHLGGRASVAGGEVGSVAAVGVLASAA